MSQEGTYLPHKREKLTADELIRYSRHLAIPLIGEQGQMRLKASKALVVGVGGLGSPISLYLTAAGVGTLGLVEFDKVEETNLQRQILYSSKMIGLPKLESAKETLSALNPNITIVTHNQAFTEANSQALVRQYDLVIDGCDNYDTRYAINHACVCAEKPFVHGAVFALEGQASVFWVGHGPCYACLYSAPPQEGVLPSNAEGGILGGVPGLIGSILAMEAIKLIVGIGDPLIGRQLLFDALRMEFRTVTVRRNPECHVCGTPR